MSFSFRRLSALLLLVWLVGCKTVPPVVVFEPTPLPVPEVAAEPEVILDDAELRKQRMLADILYEGKKAFADNRLMQPAGRNAYDFYQQVLRLDPGNKVALDGIEEIAVRYIEMAQAAISEMSLENAEAYIARAVQLSPGRPELAAVRVRLNDARKNKAQVIALNAAGISARNLQAMSQLAEIARRVQAAGSTFMIRARSDDEGRWIYKVMREAVGGYRLRGNIEVAAVPAIVVTGVAMPDSKSAKPLRD